MREQRAEARKGRGGGRERERERETRLETMKAMRLSRAKGRFLLEESCAAILPSLIFLLPEESLRNQ
jgi:hypothetical protein